MTLFDCSLYYPYIISSHYCICHVTELKIKGYIWFETSTFKITNTSANTRENVKKNHAIDIYQLLRKVIVSSMSYKLKKSRNKNMIGGLRAPLTVVGWKQNSKHLWQVEIRHRVTTLLTPEYLTTKIGFYTSYELIK